MDIHLLEVTMRRVIYDAGLEARPSASSGPTHAPAQEAAAPETSSEVETETCRLR